MLPKGCAIYISGPMSGLPQFKYPAFDDAAARLRRLGYRVINPADIGRGLGDGLPWSQYMRPCLAAVTECDALVLMPGWVDSRGAKLEHDVALAIGLQICTIDEALQGRLIDVTKGRKAWVDVPSASAWVDGMRG